MKWYEWISLLGSAASVFSFGVALYCLPAFINWRKIKKLHKQYLNTKKLKNDKFYIHFTDFYRSNREERQNIRKAVLKYSPPNYRKKLICIMNMIESQEIIEKKY